MINIDKIGQIASIISETDEFYKNGLVLVYYMDEKSHKKLDEHLFIKNGGEMSNFEHGDEIEVEVNNIKFKFLIDDSTL